MIIDIHGHVSAPTELYAYKAGLLAARGSHGRGGLRFTDAQMDEALHHVGVFGDGHLDLLDKYGTDVQFLSPRPFQLMHSERPAKIVHWLHEEFHNVIAHQVRMEPKRFVGIAALPELERCVT